MTLVTLTIDDKQLTVSKGTTILQAAASVGIEIPHYCYHPGLSIAGNCRMCLVEVEKMPKPMIACNTQATEGMVVFTRTFKVKQMQKSVMEFLLINHPLDCPTCDQAGECRLQDYYMQYDEVPTRFQEQKVHKEKMIDLGAGVMLDQERCIACSRCVRFCREIAKKDELCLANRGDHVTITTFPGRSLSNAYAGCTVDVCPVGALTSKDFRYKKRVWFLKRTPSICPGCSRGCNIEIDHADSKIYRLLPRLNPEVNAYWMCDEGRYGYKFVNEMRILRPLVLRKGRQETITWDEALAELVSEIRSHPFDELAVSVHAGETLETIGAFVAFAKNVLGTSLIFYSRNDPPNPSSDDYLITADKNPNQAEINRFSLKPLSDLKKARGLLVLNNLSDADLKIATERAVPLLAVWGANESEASKKARIVLPIPTFAEQEGHFTNVQGKVQKISRAFEPRGEAQPAPYALDILREILVGQESRRALP